MSGDVTPYQNLVTPANQLPNFLSVIGITCQGMADGIALLESMQTIFDLATAVGDQLDAVGQWIGVTRYLSEPLTGVYFAWDTAGIGWDQGVWQGPYDPSTGLVALNDDDYRVLLYARVAANYWNGTTDSAEQILAPVFPGNMVFVQDNQNMSMYIGVVGPVPFTAVTYALLTGGYLNVKPAGVRIAGYVTSSVIGTPVFGFDAETASISGWDVGSWATIAAGN